MTFSNNEIVMMIVNDKNINDYIISSVSPSYRDDFKQNLSLMILEYNNVKLNLALSSNYLTFLIIRIIKNTNNDTSPFWKETKNSGQPKSKKTIEFNYNITISTDEYDYEEDIKLEMWSKKVDSILNNYHFYYTELFKLYRSGMTYRQIESATGIKYQSVRLAVLKTIGMLKKDLEDEGK